MDLLLDYEFLMSQLSATNLSPVTDLVFLLMFRDLVLGERRRFGKCKVEYLAKQTAGYGSDVGYLPYFTVPFLVFFF